MKSTAEPSRDQERRPEAKPDFADAGRFDLDRDWSVKEMSGLRRMVEDFEPPALPAQLRCGRSDEGTPWALVCDKSGRVLLHMTIAPGRYELVAWNLSAPVRSPDLNTILRLAAENGQVAAESMDPILGHAPGAAAAYPGRRPGASQ